MPICAALYQRVLRETFTWLPAWRHNAQVFLNDARAEEVFVAVADVRILGLAAYHRPGDFLHSLYVAERGRGVGKALLAHVLRVSRGGVTLKCQAANAAAIAFYQHEGWVIRARGVDPGPLGVPWVLMSPGPTPATGPG